MLRRSRRPTRRAMGRSGSQRKSTWVTIASPPTSIPVGQTAYFELLSPVRPAADITQEVYQNMTNPTVVAVYGHVTILADRVIDCNFSPPTDTTYAWGIYKDTDVFSPATGQPPWNAGRSNLWMMHHAGFLSIPGQVICGGTEVNNYGLNDLQYRRYELSHRRYKRRLDSQNDSLIWAVENAPVPFSSTNLVVTSYFRLLLLE